MQQKRKTVSDIVSPILEFMKKPKAKIGSKNILEIVSIFGRVSNLFNTLFICYPIKKLKNGCSCFAIDTFYHF